MLRRRSRTVRDDDPAISPREAARASTHNRPTIDPQAGPSRLDLDLTGIDAPRPAWAEPVRADQGHDDDEGWHGLGEDDEDELDDIDPVPVPVAPAPPPAHARRAPLRAAPPPPTRADALSTDLQEIVHDTVSRVLSTAMVELEVEPNTLQELRDQGALHQLTAAVARIEQQTALVDGLARQIATLTTAVDELTDSTRALLRHQWDNMPPSNFWVRVQRADDEVRRALEELSSEVRGRLPRSPR